MPAPQLSEMGFSEDSVDFRTLIRDDGNVVDIWSLPRMGTYAVLLNKDNQGHETIQGYEMLASWDNMDLLTAQAVLEYLFTEPFPTARPDGA